MNRIGVEKPSPSLLGMPQRDPGGRRPRTRHPGTPSRGPRLSQGSRRRATKFRQPPGLALSGCQLLPYRVRTRLPRNPENQNATRSRSQAYFICSRISAHCARWRGARPRVFPTPKTTGCVLLAITDDQHPPRNPRRQHATVSVTRPETAERAARARRRGGDDAVHRWNHASRLYTVRVTRPPRSAPCAENNDFIHHTPCTQNRTDLAHRTARGRGSTHPTGRTCTVNWEQSTCTCSLNISERSRNLRPWRDRSGSGVVRLRALTHQRRVGQRRVGQRRVGQCRGWARSCARGTDRGVE